MSHQKVNSQIPQIRKRETKYGVVNAKREVGWCECDK